MKFGFVRVAAATPRVKVADCDYNITQIESLIHEANDKQVEIICFPELAVTAYTCGDLFFQHTLIDEAEKALSKLIERTMNLPILIIVGMPVYSGNKLFNAVVVFQSGKILAVVPKVHLPNYNEFYEKRWFSSENAETEVELCNQLVPFGKDILIKADNISIGIEVCEDLWQPIPPSSELALLGANILFNLSASNEVAEKQNYRRSLVVQQSARCVAGYVYASAGIGESSTDLVFSGSGFICENGSLLKESNRFSLENELIVSEIDVERLCFDRRKNNSFTSNRVPDNPKRIVAFQRIHSVSAFSLERYVHPHPFVPANEILHERCDEILAIQTSGLATRLMHTGIRKVVLGISGGLDSTLALLVCVKTFDKLNLPHENIIGITMPGFGTTGRTYNNAITLMKLLGISSREINIKAACIQHFNDIGHDVDVHDVTYENVQARERTQILMDIANKEGALVIGTGDLSEIALGWCTYNGDHMSMYAVNCSIPKTLIRYLIHRTAENQLQEAAPTLFDILATPVSPELLPPKENGEINQKTEDVIGPYELHDFFLYYFVRWGFSPKKIFFLTKQAFKDTYNDGMIIRWMTTFFKRFFSQQFKRSCMPDGPKVGSVSLSPRGDWRMPSDASAQTWLKELEEIKTLV